MKNLLTMLILLISITVFGQQSRWITREQSSSLLVFWIYSDEKSAGACGKEVALINGEYWSRCNGTQLGARKATPTDWANMAEMPSQGFPIKSTNPNIMNDKVFAPLVRYSDGSSNVSYFFGKIEGTLNTNDFNMHKVSVYPNPARDLVHIDINTELSGKIYNLSGKSVMNVDKKNIDISPLNAGVYLLDIVSDDKRFVSKIVKE